MQVLIIGSIAFIGTHHGGSPEKAPRIVAKANAARNVRPAAESEPISTTIVRQAPPTPNGAQDFFQYIPVTSFSIAGFPVFMLVPFDGSRGGDGHAAVSPATVWTMINVCPNQGQADCHLLEFPDGTHALIDVGEGFDAHGAAVKYLKQVGITHIELVVLSHVHWDHYGKLIDVINSGIKVDRVALSLPGDRSIADAEKPWGCDWDEVQALLRFLAEHGVAVWTPKFGEHLIDIRQGGTQTLLEVVCFYDGINSPVGRSDVNDTSMILRLTHGPTRALFTGDLNTPIGTWLATSSFDLKADILKVPHHGTEGLAPNSFFDRVGAKIAMVPSPMDLWYSLRSKRSRDYFKQRGVPTFVSGIHGTVKVVMTKDSYSIATTVAP